MPISRIEAAGARPLENLGISEAEERVYRWLLTHRGASALEAARELTLAAPKAQRLLESIEGKGLATHTPERPRRYIPSSPDVALEALISQRQKGLQDARLAAQELQDVAASGPRQVMDQVVELITNRDIERQVLKQIQDLAKEEILCLARPPARILRLNVDTEKEHSEQRQAQLRGVVYRTIVAADFFDLPGAVQSINSDMEAGESLRVAATLPLKAFIADRRVALIPLSVVEEDGPSLLVRSSAVVDALCALFELLWNRAAPISSVCDTKQKTDDGVSQLDEEAKRLVSLLAAGLNDKKIAYDLSISKRTFERRIAKLMQALNARSRFQMGWLSALQLSNIENASVLAEVSRPKESCHQNG
jgi:sugar-specific transcriptional regulator TrmB/DNA-binding CsgD family transcriptional regulator